MTQPCQMQGSDLPKPLHGIFNLLEFAAAFCDHVIHRLVEDGDQEIVLALEIKVNSTVGNACSLSNIGDLRLEESAAGEYLDGGPQNRLILLIVLLAAD